MVGRSKYSSQKPATMSVALSSSETKSPFTPSVVASMNTRRGGEPVTGQENEVRLDGLARDHARSGPRGRAPAVGREDDLTMVDGSHEASGADREARTPAG